MRLLRLLALGTGILTLLLPEMGFMQPITVNTSFGSTPCLLGSLYCPGNGFTGAATYIGTTLFVGAKSVFLAAAVILFLQYGVRLMMESSEESTISEVKSAYTYAIAGCAIVTVADIIVQTVGQGVGNQARLVNASAVSTALGTIVGFLRIMVGTALTGVVVYQGMRMIILQGQESEIEAQKKRFLHTLIGVAVMTLANVIVADFMPGSASSDLVVQITGIVNFLMELIGGLAVLAMIVAGLFLVLSTDEGLKDRAKKTIFATVIGLIVLLTCYTIVNFVMTLNPSGLRVY